MNNIIFSLFFNGSYNLSEVVTAFTHPRSPKNIGITDTELSFASAENRNEIIPTKAATVNDVASPCV